MKVEEGPQRERERLMRCEWEGEKKGGQRETALFKRQAPRRPLLCAEGDWAVAACDAVLSLSTSPGWPPEYLGMSVRECPKILDPGLSLTPGLVLSGKHDEVCLALHESNRSTVCGIQSCPEHGQLPPQPARDPVHLGGAKGRADLLASKADVYVFVR